MNTVEHLIRVISTKKKYSDIARTLIKTEARNEEWYDFLIGVAKNESIPYEMNRTDLNNIIGKLYINDVKHALKEQFSGENMDKKVKDKVVESTKDSNVPKELGNVGRKDSMRAVVNAIRNKDFEAASTSFKDYTTVLSKSIIGEDYGYGDNETKLYNMILKNPKYKDEVEDMKYNGADKEEFARFVNNASRNSGLRLSREEVFSLSQTLMRTNQ